jgi:hypothetical protein
MYKQQLTSLQKIKRECVKGWQRFSTNTCYWIKTGGRGWACQSPILIVGCGHTGTTWLLRILAAHPDLYAIPYESSYARRKDIKDSGKFVARFNRETIRKGKTRWLEKTPKHVRHIERIFELHPESKIIVMVRDPRDVIASLKQRAGNFDEAFLRWKEDNTAAEQWREDPRVTFIRYEDLKNNFEHALKQVVEFTELSWNDRILNYTTYDFPFLPQLEQTSGPNKNGNIEHLKQRQWQINQKDYDGRGRWKKDLTNSEIQHITIEGAALMDLQHYKTESM